MMGISSQSHPSSSESLSIAKSIKIRGGRAGLEHVSEVLPRILATIDRQPLGKLSEQEEGRSHFYSPQNQKVAPLPVTSSYPLQGGML
jgi:hypothetical protein